MRLIMKEEASVVKEMIRDSGVGGFCQPLQASKDDFSAEDADARRHFCRCRQPISLGVLTFPFPATNHPSNAGPKRPVFVLTCPVVFSVR